MCDDRLSRDGTLIIDGGEEVKGSSKGPLQVLNVQGNIFFGKLPCHNPFTLSSRPVIVHLLYQAVLS